MTNLAAYGCMAFGTASPPCPYTTQICCGLSSAAQSSTCCTSGLTANACSTLGFSEYLRLPFPAARMTMFNGVMFGFLEIADYKQKRLSGARLTCNYLSSRLTTLLLPRFRTWV